MAKMSDLDHKVVKSLKWELVDGKWMRDGEVCFNEAEFNPSSNPDHTLYLIAYMKKRGLTLIHKDGRPEFVPDLKNQ